jgi:hypothetical protein
MAKSKFSPWKSPDTLVRSVLAIAVVVYAGWFLMKGGKVDGDVQARSAIILGVVGLVLGYYFGSRGASQAEGLANDLSSSQGKLLEGVNSALDVVRSKRKIVTQGLLANPKATPPPHAQELEQVENQLEDLLRRHSR